MIEILNITADYNQSFNISLEDGSNLFFKINYIHSQKSWFFSLQKDAFIINNLRLVTTPSLLFQFKNIINFDILVLSSDIYDPGFLTDFTTGRIRIFVLNADDRQFIDTTISGIINGN